MYMLQLTGYILYAWLISVHNSRSEQNALLTCSVEEGKQVHRQKVLEPEANHCRVKERLNVANDWRGNPEQLA